LLTFLIFSYCLEEGDNERETKYVQRKDQRGHEQKKKMETDIPDRANDR